MDGYDLIIISILAPDDSEVSVIYPGFVIMDFHHYLVALLTHCNRTAYMMVLLVMNSY